MIVADDKPAEEKKDGNELSELMSALGSVVVIWGMVEDITRKLMRDVVLGSDEENVDRIILSETPFRVQVDILKKVAWVRRPKSAWFERLVAVLNELSGSLHADRNRFIHDLWEPTDEGEILKYVRGKEETAVSKKGGEWQLRITGERAVPVAEVEAFFDKVADAFETMLDLKAEYADWKIRESVEDTMSAMIARGPMGELKAKGLMGALFGKPAAAEEAREDEPGAEEGPGTGRPGTEEGPAQG